MGLIANDCNWCNSVNYDWILAAANYWCSKSRTCAHIRGTTKSATTEPKMSDYEPHRNIAGTIVSLLLIIFSFTAPIGLRYGASIGSVSFVGFILPFLEILSLFVANQILYVIIGVFGIMASFGYAGWGIFGTFFGTPYATPYLVYSLMMLIWSISYCIPLRIKNGFVTMMRPFSLVKKPSQMPQHVYPVVMGSPMVPVAMSPMMQPVSPVMVASPAYHQQQVRY